ncbi:uncharacterized protein LOC115626651 isoform X2 [Scaptodrosophila lebanonensis]|uniref:Uncharacterized protein LOC115626651 isoform X2 n=1 Tax=Drosophila lebanonensis TaxID=7225 RepID=A0A6J2TS29_DROLE|nr:uncharacterized protein LOC115626651 isoform X2 [Scaptodrosophila lebanonensis]
MDFVGSRSFIFICKAIENQCDIQYGENCKDFQELLKSLTPKEKLLASKYFCQLPWKIGTLRVLRQFQDLRLLTATEYILSIQNNVQVQLVLNEFLEAEYELLENIFISAAYDSFNAIILNAALEDLFYHLFNDLASNPKISSLAYLAPLCKSLPANVLTKVMHTHIHILLNLHASDINQAFIHFSDWINKGVDELVFIKVLCEKEWKFYVILIQSIASTSNADTTMFLKQYLKSRLLKIGGAPCKLSMLHLLLTARAATARTMSVKHNLDAYASWYKENICEMNYMMDVERFQNVLNLLQECITYEKEQQYLEIHAAMAISPPPLCGKLVQAYRSKCKAHLIQLKGCLKRKASIEMVD